MPPTALRLGLCALALVALCPASPADDWPQWMGPNRDGVWSESDILATFPAEGPKKLWSVPLGGGYSGPAVVGGKVYTMDYHRATGEAENNPAKRNELTGKERLICLDAATGKELWSHVYDCSYHVSYPAGPRCTPTVSGGKVYSLGAMGHLNCCDAATGTVIWSKDFPKDYRAPVPIWGFCGHPIVHDKLLICLVGGEGSVAVAFDKDTGKEVWKALSAPESGYCPPTMIHSGGVSQVVIWHSKSLNGLNPLTGETYWKAPLEPNYGMSIMAPRQSGQFLFAGGIMGKAALLKLGDEKTQVEVVWRGTGANAIYPVNATPIVDGGTMYGIDQPGALRAVKLSTGERLWSTFKPVLGEDKDDDYRGVNSGTAFLVKNREQYFLFAETGHLIIAKLTPEKYEELSRAKLVEPSNEAFGRKVVWSHPAFANRCVFVRNDKEIACFSLAAK